MIRRRHVVGGLAAATCGCPMGRRAGAQWPGAATGRAEVATDVPVGGCGLDAESARRFARQYRIHDWLDEDDQLHLYFIDCYQAAEEWFGVTPKFGFYDDGDNLNAFATPIHLFGTAEADGTVVFGHTLLANQLARGAIGRTGMLVIVAHEYAHIRQFREKRGGHCPDTELEADFLAGWMLGREGSRHEGIPFDMTAAAETLFAFGGYDYNNPGFHGTPEQRQDAVLRGHEFGRRGADLDSAYRASLARG